MMYTIFANRLYDLQTADIRPNPQWEAQIRTKIDLPITPYAHRKGTPNNRLGKNSINCYKTKKLDSK